MCNKELRDWAVLDGLGWEQTGPMPALRCDRRQGYRDTLSLRSSYTALPASAVWLGDRTFALQMG